MEFKRIWFLYTGVFFVSALLGIFCRADDRAKERASLRGIKAVVVKVLTFEPEWSTALKKVRLTESLLESSIIHQLERAGIQALTEEISSKSESEGILNVRIKFMDPEPSKKEFLITDEEQDEKQIIKFDSKKRYVYAIRFNLRQMVSLQRDQMVKISAITWQTESLGFRRLIRIRDDAMNLVDVFIEAYLSENSHTETNE